MEQASNLSGNTLALVIGLGFGLAVLLVLAAVGLVIMRREEPTQRRLRGMLGREAKPKNSPAKRQLKQVILGLLGRLAKPARPRQDWQANQIRTKLLQAGFQAPNAVNTFLGFKVALLIIFPLAVFISPIPGKVGNLQLMLSVVGAACLGFFLPQFMLESRIRTRRKAITRELPDVLDLLVIAVEAGLGLDQAIRRVADEVSVSSPTLGSEFNLVSLEMRAGIPRQMALRNLAQRCGVEEVSSLVAMLIQADRFGVSVGRSLRVHSDTVRTKRRQQMEEAAAKIPLKLLFPVLFMIFPAIMVVMAGPAVIRVSQNLLN